MIEKDGKIYYFCSHYKNDEFGYPEGLYVCSYRPDQHDEYVAYRRLNKPFHINKTPAPDKPTPSGKLIMADNIHKVLTTTQPHLSESKINKLMDQVSKE